MMNKAIFAVSALSLVLIGCAETRSTMGPGVMTGPDAPEAAPLPPPTDPVPPPIDPSLAGATVTGPLNTTLDDRDRRVMIENTQRALSTGVAGKPVRWTNSTTGSSGTVTPQPTYTDRQSRTCREYQETIITNGQSKTGYRTACQDTGGAWRNVNG